MNPLDFDRFAVWGAARSGVAAANLLASLGKEVLLSDSAPLERIEERTDGLMSSVRFEAGRNVLGDAQALVVSPGLKPSLPVFDGVTVPIVSEVEVARRVSGHRWIAITGTDGKTTTTELTTHLLRGAGLEAVSAGNIGTPLAEVVLELDPDAVIVAEVSAFQLWSTHYLPTRAVTVTNLAGDHLDYFDGDFEAYGRAKRRLLELAGPDATAVLHETREPMKTWGAEYGGPVRQIRADGEPGRDLWFDGKSIRRGDVALIEWENVPLIGPHNALNVMTACGLAESVGARPETFATSLETFRPLPHRVERVGQVGGVTFINDSKATNAHAALTGLEAISGELVVIAGGVDKGLELGEFASYLAARKAEVVLIGDIRERLTAALRDAGLPAESLAAESSLESAVAEAYKRAKPGKTIVLSPACSSFDMFESYADRGEQFRACVERLVD